MWFLTFRLIPLCRMFISWLKIEDLLSLDSSGYVFYSCPWEKRLLKSKELWLIVFRGWVFSLFFDYLSMRQISREGLGQDRDLGLHRFAPVFGNPHPCLQWKFLSIPTLGWWKRKSPHHWGLGPTPTVIMQKPAERAWLGNPVYTFLDTSSPNLPVRLSPRCQSPHFHSMSSWV